MTTPGTYDAGTASVGAGGTAVTGQGTAWALTLQPGDLFHAQGLSVPIAAVVSNTELTLAYGWPGASLDEDAYLVLLADPAARALSTTIETRRQLNILDANGRGLFYNLIGVTGDNDPGPGNIALNSATPETVTEAYIDVLDANTVGRDVSGIIDLWKPGTVLVIRSIVTAAYAAYRVEAAPETLSGYRRVSLDYVSHDGTLATEAIAIEYNRAVTDAGDLTEGTIADGRMPINIRATAAAVTDANDALNSGWYSISSAQANIPGTQSGILFVTQYNADNVVQVFYGLNGQRAERTLRLGVWGAWQNTDALASTIDTKTANYTAVAGDSGKVIKVDASGAARTLTLLPAAAAGAGYKLIVKKTDSSSNTVTLDGNGSETINGELTYVLRLQDQAVAMVCDGTAWHLLSEASVIKRGSNGNGKWVKYADGRLECWNNDAGDLAANSASGQLFRSPATAVWVYPVPFVGDEPIVTGGADAAGVRWITVSPTSGAELTQCNFSHSSQVSSASAIGSRLRAIGDWF